MIDWDGTRNATGRAGSGRRYEISGPGGDHTGLPVWSAVVFAPGEPPDGEFTRVVQNVTRREAIVACEDHEEWRWRVEHGRLHRAGPGRVETVGQGRLAAVAESNLSAFAT